ncbi:hypothetical protein CDIK_0368 [Cucumispora dikerogammari]|nr:hypothetical protein CDIK_0368 [Cucumispora dikerogammari]
MLTQISLSLDAFRCRSIDQSMTSSPPVITGIDTIKTSFMFNESENSENQLSIKSNICFKDLDFIETYYITEDKLSTGLNILFINTTSDSPAKKILGEQFSYEEEASEIINSIQTTFSRISQSSEFVLSLESKYKTDVNPVIQYLKDNPTKAFQLFLILPGPTQKHLHDELVKALTNLKVEIESLHKLLEEEMFAVLDQLRELNKNTLNKGTKTSSLIKQIDTLIKRLKKLKKEPQLIKEKMFICLNTIQFKLKNWGVYESDFNVIIALSNLLTSIKEYIKKKIGSEVLKLNISKTHALKIIRVFEKEIDECILVKNRLFSVLIDKISEKIKDEAKFVTTETGFYRLNNDIGELEEIRNNDAQPGLETLKKA